MLFLLLKFLYIVVLSFLYGYSVQQLLARRILKNEPEQPSFPLTVLIGLCFISIYGAILSIFMPLGATAQIIILATALLIFFMQRTAIIQQFNHYIQAVL